jgi:lipoprotein-anchoring transpeptidase ErfK/SrfK
MRSLRYVLALSIALILVCVTSSPVLATILIQIDKPTQRMTVSVDGQVRYRWPVSTGATGYSTPAGSYTAFRMVRMHYSQEWDNAGMPHSIFFTKRGHAIHGSNHPRLGSPASHGCVRLSLSNAATLYELVQAYGVTGTQVVVMGSDPPGVFPPTEAPEQRRVRSRPRRPFLPFFR